MNGSSAWNDTSMCWNGTCVSIAMADNSSVQESQKMATIVVPIFFALIIIVGFIGNALVVVVVLCNQQMRSTTNILITNLAMADLIFLVFCAPFTATRYAFSNWTFGDIWCGIYWYLASVSGCASIYILALLSLDRFLAVVYPIASMSIRSKKNAYLAISSTWTVILVIFVPVLVIHGEIQNPYALGNYRVCVFLTTQGYNFTAYNIPYFLLSYVIPLTTIFVLYLLIMKKLWFGATSGGQFGVRSKTRVTRLVFVVILIFAVCWSPVQIAFFLKSVNMIKINASKLMLRIVAETLAYFNSCVNPILYAFLSENFRKGFRKVLSRSPLRACKCCDKTKRVTFDENVSNIRESSKESMDIL